LYRLDRRNGSVLTEFPASSSVESEAVVHDGAVFFTDSGGGTWCYDLDGTLRWMHDSKAPILVRPTVADGRVYITTVDDLVVVLDAQTGELVWRYQQRPDITRRAELALYGAPPAVVDASEVLVGFSDGALVALSQEGGDPVWTARVGQGRYPDLVAEPTAVQDLIFVAGYFEPFIAIERDTKKIRWSHPYGAASGALLAGAQEDATLFHPGTDGSLRAIAAVTGDLKWTWESGTSGALTTPILTEAGLMIASSLGSVTLLDAETGDARWTFTPPYLMEGITSAPVVDGRQLLFVSNAGKVYSLLSPQPNTSGLGRRGEAMVRESEAGTR
jgi:outer membrane protein assembly factor BamB